MKILIASTFPTHPTNAGNRAWILGQAETLKESGHEVYFLFVLHESFHSVSEESISETKRYWGDHYIEYHLSRFDTLRIKLLALFARLHHGYIGCDDKYPLGLSAFVKHINEEKHFDLCIVNYFFLTKLFKDVSFPKTAVSTHDCFSYRDVRTHDYGTMSLTANEEARAMQRCNYIFALQDEECAYFQHLAPNSMVLNVYGRFVYHPTPIMNNHVLVMLASGINYNVESIVWFIEKVLPLLREKFDDAMLVIGGSACKKLQNYTNHHGIELLGFVKEPIDLYMMGDISINPVSRGTGLKIKTFESIAYDKVTIVHPHSMAGIFNPDQAPLKVARNPEEWVSCIAEIWGNDSKVTEIKASNRLYLKKMRECVNLRYKLVEEL